MRLSTGPWVSGEDFFDREADLQILKRQVRNHNHVLLSGQRRMGKTSLVRELGQQLEAEGWISLFADVEGASCPEDAVAGIAQAAHAVRPIARRFADAVGRWFDDKVEEVTAAEFGIKIRAGLDAGSWRRHGEQLLRDCAAQDQPVLLAIDELPIFLKRMLSQDGNDRRVDEFLSWLRGTVQDLGHDSPVLIVSGSVGLEPLVRRLGIPDRINHFYSYRLQPWDRDTSIACFGRLAKSHGLSVEDGVAEAVYETLGIGVPHQIQSFFARLADFIALQGRGPVAVEDVREVYRTGLLGPAGQSDLAHYETRLKDALENENHAIAMQVLAETAIKGVFTPEARRRLELLHALIMEDVSERISEAMEVLEHDGYLETTEDGHRFSSRLLQDWWAARFRGHYIPLVGGSGDETQEQV